MYVLDAIVSSFLEISRLFVVSNNRNSSASSEICYALSRTWTTTALASSDRWPYVALYGVDS